MSDRPIVRGAELFGVDVHSGDVRGEAPTYALVRFDGEVVERDTVSARKLRRLIERHEPAIVAVDNIYELASDKDALIQLLRDLPDGTRLVQVTGDERPEPLSRVAHRHDVAYDASPMGEAEAAARLAAARVGSVVTAFEERTRVTVSRGRSVGKGGSSEDRFTRRIHGSVRHRARQVTDELEAAGLSFEREVTEKYGGWSRAEFEVAAPPGDLPVGEERAGDVRVEVEPVSAGGLRFEPLARRRERVIVGVDPGTNTAVGLVDLDGNALDAWSSRTSDTGEVVEWIVERGRPLIVAADVETMPDTVDRIRRSFDAVGWTPAADLPVDEKLHRCRDVPFENDHERDALAAALFAHDAHADLLERIRHKVPPPLEVGAVAEVVLGEGLAIDAAVDRLLEEPSESEATDAPAEPVPNPQRRRISSLESRVRRQRDHIDRLREHLADRADRIEELERELDEARARERREVRRERLVTRLEREKRRLARELEDRDETIAELEDKVDRMKALWRLDHSNFATVEEAKRDLVPVKPVEKFTEAAIRRADADYGLAPGDVVWLRDASGAGADAARTLAELEPRVVLKDGGLSDVARRVLQEAEVPTGPVADVAVQEVDELAVARESDVEAVVDAWEERANRRRREAKRELVDQLIDEHRRDREPSR
ncbi:MAG: DUF460 domain-containing protein [Halobacteriales archaeon]